MVDDPQRSVGMHITSDPERTEIEQPDTAGARETNQLPLRLILVSDLAPQQRVDDWSRPSRVRRVDKNSFGDLMREMAPRLTLDVPNKISDTPKQLEVQLGFGDMQAFHPVQVAQQVPSLAQLLQVRTLVRGVADGAVDMDTFRGQLQEAGVDEDWAEQLYRTLLAPEEPTGSGSEATGEDDTLSRLLGMVDHEDDQSPPAAEASKQERSALDALMEAVTGGEEAAGPKAETSAANLLLAELDEVLSDQLNAILGHAAFRQLEAAWRGLRFLVDRIDFRRNVQLEVLAAGKEELSTALHHQVLLPEHDEDTEKPPLSALILDVAFDNGKQDVAQLDDLAETGASLQVPILASVAPAFFGIQQLSGLAKLPLIRQHLEGPEYIEWNKLREKKEARYLALAMPPFALRYPYGGDRPVEAFDFDEDGCVWGGGALAVAAAVADSFVQSDWPTHIVGREVEDLPVTKSAQGHTPLAALIPEKKHSELAEAGFVVLSGKPNDDALKIVRAPTICRPEQFDDLVAATEARVHVSLACQLFVARAAHFILLLQEAIPPSSDIDETRQEVERQLQAFFHTEGHTVPNDAVSVEHVKEMELPGHEMMAVRLRPPKYVLSRSVSLVLGLHIPKAEAEG